jgi:hypothetical protein
LPTLKNILAVCNSPLKLTLTVTICYSLLSLALVGQTPHLQPQLFNFSADRFFLFIHPGAKWDPLQLRPFNTEYIGYDGQFFYDLAVHPLHPTTLLDKPPYRTARILYPLLVHLLAWGQVRWIPILLMLLNLLVIAVSTYLLTKILIKLKRMPVWALLYVVWPGTLCAYLYDLSEPLCFAFVLAAIWFYLYQPRFSIYLLGLLLLLGSLTKELALLFGVGWVFYYLLERQWRKVNLLLLSWLVPYIGWQVFLYYHFGQDGLSAGQPFSILPFGGFFLYTRPSTESLVIFLASIVPSMWALWLIVGKVLWKKWYRKNTTEIAYSPLLASSQLLCQLAFLLFLPAASYIYLVDHARNATGLLLAILLWPDHLFANLRKYLLVVSLGLSVFVVLDYFFTGNAFLAQLTLFG